jgi:hypothetical protein
VSALLRGFGGPGWVSAAGALGPLIPPQPLGQRLKTLREDREGREGLTAAQQSVVEVLEMKVRIRVTRDRSEARKWPRREGGGSSAFEWVRWLQRDFRW